VGVILIQIFESDRAILVLCRQFRALTSDKKHITPILVGFWSAHHSLGRM
jgi:hypothetical protein